MSRATRKVAKLYGAWVLPWFVVAALGEAFAGHGEYGIVAHFNLTVTGLPLSLLSWHIIPNGSATATLVAGAIGLLQWSIVADANSVWKKWRAGRRAKGQKQ